MGGDLLTRAKAHVAAAQGSLLVTTSPRTTMEVADLFENEIGHAHFLPLVAARANPYQSFLRLADDFIVTNDSVSMIAEAVDMMKPLYVFQVPRREKRRNMGLFQTIRHYFRSRRNDRRIAGIKPDFSDRVYDAMTRFGLIRPRRSVDAFERRLYQAGSRAAARADRGHGARAGLEPAPRSRRRSATWWWPRSATSSPRSAPNSGLDR